MDLILSSRLHKQGVVLPYLHSSISSSCEYNYENKSSSKKFLYKFGIERIVALTTFVFLDFHLQNHEVYTRRLEVRLVREN